MKRTPGLIVIALSGFLVACGGASAPTDTVVTRPTPPPTPAAKLVIVSIDGLRPDGLLAVNPPNMSALARRGSYTWQARTITPSNTLPSHISMLTGYLPARHGITWDEYEPAKGTSRVPTIFLFARRAGLKTALVAGKEKFNTLRDTQEIDVFVGGTRPDLDIVDQAVAQLYAGADLLFIHLPDVDLAGHATSWMSTAYKDKVMKADELLGRIMSVLPDTATLILTADHGGHAAGHGTTESLDMTIPWLIVGPRIRQAYALTAPVSTMDTAATALHILGLTPPPDLSGKPVLEAFVR
jgi:predicted AlkP superfamily pyrophosphatase or phosphodiesterase